MKPRRIIGMVVPVILAGCQALHPDQCLNQEIRTQIAQDMDTVTLIAIVRLDEAQVTGNWPVVAKGANVKTEVAIEKRAYTRAELWLRGSVDRCLKGQSETNRANFDSEATRMEKGNYLESDTNHVSFDISTGNLVANRDNTCLDVPASNIPDLIIGEKYVVMFHPRYPAKLYYTCIWPAKSLEARFIEDRLKNMKTSNQAPEDTARKLAAPGR